ncbi:MAG: response regulator [bacterium]|nr:response regulator [bacterium]
MQCALVVDDNLGNRGLVGAILTGLGYEVVAAGSVREARELLSRSPVPVLAVLDYNLPDGTGPDIAHLLRECYGQDIRIVSISGNMGPDAKWKPEERELYNEVLGKPFDVKDLELATASPRSP